MWVRYHAISSFVGLLAKRREAAASAFANYGIKVHAALAWGTTSMTRTSLAWATMAMRSKC